MAQGNRAESRPERVRRLLGVEPGEPRNAPTEHEQEQVKLIRQKVLSQQQVINDTAKAMMLMHVDQAVETVLHFATRAGGSPSLQFDAARYVLEHASQSGIAGIGKPLAELPLDQLETVLAGALDNAKQLRAIAGQAQRVDTTEETLPPSGTDGPGAG
jgi:hypothetical protein